MIWFKSSYAYYINGVWINPFVMICMGGMELKSEDRLRGAFVIYERS